MPSQWPEDSLQESVSDAAGEDEREREYGRLLRESWLVGVYLRLARLLGRTGEEAPEEDGDGVCGRRSWAWPGRCLCTGTGVVVLWWSKSEELELLSASDNTRPLDPFRAGVA